MRILIDSGATKSDCLLLTNNKEYIHHVTSQGINANYCEDSYIGDIFTYFREEIRRFTDETISLIEYYGAGCGSIVNVQRITALLSIFPDTSVTVGSDLLGACRLLSPDKSGMVAILGTGASACIFDGKDITRQAPSTGYMLGDEGSGTHIGKLFITCYFRNELPNNIKVDFENQFQLTAPQILHRIYQEKSPNLFFSSLSPFVAAHKGEPFIERLLNRAFGDFFEKQVLYFEDYRNYPLNIIGSVAFHFADDIKKVAQHYEVTMGNLTASPLNFIRS